MEGNPTIKSPQARVQLQLRKAYARADAISRELDDLGLHLRHLELIESSIEQVDWCGTSDLL